MNNRPNPREEINKLYHAPANRPLKYACFATIGIAFLLLLSIIILDDKLSLKTVLIIRGFAGLFAIVFVTLATILTYRVWSQYVNKPKK